MTRKLITWSTCAALALLLGQGVAAGQLNSAERRCSDAANKIARKIAKYEQKADRLCVKNGNGDISACIGAESANAAEERIELQELFEPGGKCNPVPPFGVNPDPDEIADAVETGADDIIEDAFGNPPDGIVDGDRCQDRVAKRAGNKYEAIFRAFRGCARDLPAINNTGNFESCVGSAIGGAKVTKAQGKLLDDTIRHCTFSPSPPGFEDGDCAAAGNAADLATCMGDVVDCEACLAINIQTGGDANCDLLDDGSLNTSCGTDCPLDAGIYTFTQTAGGLMTLDGLSPFPFPSGGTTIEHVSAATAPDCVHDAVVPFPGGFSAPTFCIPGLNFSIRMSQTGCGVGKFDSNGGSDFTVTEIGDTSSPFICGFPASNCATPPGDSNVQVDITVGGNGPDVCGGGATANSIVSVPVFTVIWQHTPVSTCPDPDGMPGGPNDTLAWQFPQVLDYTTDTNSADWTDLDPDGCCLAGSGPSSYQACAFGGGGPAGLSSTGSCINLAGINVAGADSTAAASGPIGLNGGFLYDVTFTTTRPSELSGPSGAPTATCGSPPVINFSGTATRCIP